MRCREVSKQSWHGHLCRSGEQLSGTVKQESFPAF